MKELAIHHIHDLVSPNGRLRITYRAEPGAQPQECISDFAFDVTSENRRLMQWYLEEYLLYPWGEFRTRAHHTEQLMEQIGRDLFEAVFSTRHATAIYSHVARDLSHTRFVIHAANPRGIALPWELMCDATKGKYGVLSHLAHAFVRSQPDLTMAPSPEPQPGNTFNILMIIARPGGRSDVAFQSVARPLLALLRPHRDRVRLDILRPPTFEKLASALSSRPDFYHVVHFDGHGSFPQSSAPAQFYSHAGDQGRLAFEDRDGGAHPVSGEALGRILAGKRVPVVLLNACQSGMSHPESLYPSVANQLLRAGARGVVAMAYSVYVQTASRFMARLYEALINGEELGRAVSVAREDLLAHPRRFSPVGEIDLRDWLVPVLFEAAPTRVASAHDAAVRLTPDLLEDRHGMPNAEIGCPLPPPFGFVGRDDDLLDLERAFRSETIVLLDGMVGVGKTETAVSFARWWAETGALDDPWSRVFFFSFANHLAAAEVCDCIGRQYNSLVRKQLHCDWQLLNAKQRLQIVVAILKQVPCVLIWDNFEAITGSENGGAATWSPEEQAALRQFLWEIKNGRTKVLLTSRHDEPWLGPVYRRVSLEGLDVGAAQELAVRVLLRAGMKPKELQSLPDYNPLLTYLDGNPLAIQVILPELRYHSPTVLLTKLREGTVALAESTSEYGRDRSLSASLAYRIGTFDATLRQRLGVLGLFQGIVVNGVLELMGSLDESPELIRGLTRSDWDDVLNRAEETGFLRRLSEGGFSVHPAAPWFLRGLRDEAFGPNAPQLRVSYVAAYAAHAYALQEAVKSSRAAAITALELEEQNLRHALQIAIDYQGAVYAMQILQGLVCLFTTRGRWTEWRTIVSQIRETVAAADWDSATDVENLRFQLLCYEQEIAHHYRDFEAEMPLLQQLMARAERKGDLRNRIVLMEQTGNVAFERGDLREAERIYQQALALAASEKSEHEEGILLHKLGMIAQEREDFEAASAWYYKSLDVRKKIGDEFGIASSLHQLAVLAQRNWRFDEAERVYLLCLATWDRIGDEREKSNVYHNLGAMAQDRRQFVQAERWFRECLQSRERMCDEYGQASVLRRLGVIAQEQDRLEEAERWIERSLAIANNIGDEDGRGASLLDLGNVASRRGDLGVAIRLYRESLAIAGRIGKQRGRAAGLQQLGIALFRCGKDRLAYRLLRRSLEVRTRISDGHGMAQVLYHMGNVLGANGQLEGAKCAFGKALDITQRIGDEYGAAKILHHLGAVLEELSELSAAEQACEQAEEIMTRMADSGALAEIRESLQQIRARRHHASADDSETISDE